METSNLKLPYILAAQSQKHVTHNEALRALDAIVQLAVLDKDLSAPPGSPAEGSRYIVAGSPTGAWAGHATHVAAWQDGTWAFYAPVAGWLAWVDDESESYLFSGGGWIPAPGGGGASLVPKGAWSAIATYTTGDLVEHEGCAFLSNIDDNVANEPDATTPGSTGEWTYFSVVTGGGGGGGGVASVNPVPLVGVNATADATNRLSIASPASLFSHEGAGHQLKINKDAAADTASVLFQTGFSGRAEFGLAGDDDFHVKVSADGSAWTEALVINRASGAMRAKAGQVDVSSAATCDIGAAAAQRVRITGTTTITGFGVVANELRFATFAAALTLTHNATSLVLPGGANIVTAAGDTAIFASDGSGNWRCLAYQRAANAAGGGSAGPAGPEGPEGPPGETGDPGEAGAQGEAGWSPVLAAATDGGRRVLQVVDWQGGEGTKPTTGLYAGAAGLVSDIADGADVRGPQGDQGPQGLVGTSYAGTSETALEVESGVLGSDVAFSTEAGLAFQFGARARATATADGATWVEGTVVGYAGASLSIGIDKIHGAGTFDNWAINLAGEPGLDGEGAGTVNAASGGIALVGGGSTVQLTDTGATPGAYGGAGSIPILTVDQKGRITSIDQVTVSSTPSDYDHLRTSIGYNAMMLADVIGFAQFPSPSSIADSFDDLTYVDVGGASNLDTSAAGILKPALSSATALTNLALNSTDTSGWTNYTFRQYFAAGVLSGSGTSIRFRLRGPSSGSSTFSGLSFGHRTSGDNYDIDGTPTPITIGGNAVTSLATGADVWSDWIPFAYDETAALVVAIRPTSNLNCRRQSLNASNYILYWKSGVNELTTGNASGYSSTTGECFIVEEIQVSSGAGDLAVRTTALPLVGEPDAMSGLLLVREVDSATPNTDFGMRFSRNNGADWEDVTLSLLRTVPSAGGVTLKLYTTDDVDMTGEAFATACRAQLWTANAKMVEMHGLFVYGK